MATIDNTETQLHPREMTPSPRKRSSVSQFFYNQITNAIYICKHQSLINIPFLHRTAIELGSNSNPVVFLGKTFEPGQEEKFRGEYQNSIWFSYRRNIKGVGDDSGWGCMIRAAQMLLAETLKQNLGLTALQTLEYFAENEYSVFSLVNICKQGNIKRRWTCSSEVISSCMKLAEKKPCLKLTIRTEIAGYVDIDALRSHFEHSDQGLLLSVECRLGLTNIQEEHILHLKQLMKFPQFVGCLGGTAGNALYLLGFQEDDFICMDPHYVQESDSNTETSFKAQPRGIHYSLLTGSMALNFLLKNQQQCEQWIERVHKVNNLYRGSTIFLLKEDGLIKVEVSTEDSEESEEEEYEKIE